MPTKIVLGAQWGDEGKAKVVDYLTQDADIVVRYQGGANAGHTVVVGEETFIFHVIPSGIMHPDKTCVIGNGVVLDPLAFITEVDDLKSKGFTVEGRLFVSLSAHLVMPYHRELDLAAEESQGSGRLGTTGRGIGPCYRDKVERRYGIRVMDILDADHLRARMSEAVAAKNEILTKIYGREPLDTAAVVEEYLAYAARLRPFAADASVLLNEALDRGEEVLFEGAQGTLLDVDHGTYPYVTSSNTTAGGACTGSGVAPTRINEVIGVTKAYTTRVGNGPFPTELLDEVGERIRQVGHEFGATTGRSRRCGWFDSTILRLATRVNGLTSIALTRLDILDSFEELKLCTGYRCGDQVLEEFPADPRVLDKCEPIYETMAGWCAPTDGIRSYDALPANARAYIERIAELGRAPVSIVSVGPERDATIQVGS